MPEKTLQNERKRSPNGNQNTFKKIINEVDESMRKIWKKEETVVGGGRAPGPRRQPNLNEISFENFLHRNLSKEKNILRKLLQSKIGKVRSYSNTPVGRGIPGPERIPMRHAARTTPPLIL